MNPTPPTPMRSEDAPSPSQRKALALRRLEASRSQLINQIYPKPTPRASATGTQASSPPSAVWEGMDALMNRIQRNGLVTAVWRTGRALGRRWWKRQPWHSSVELITSTLAHEAQPIVRRHPVACLAAAAAAGAAVATALPWAARSLEPRVRPWRDNFGGMLWSQLAQAPVQMAITGALTAWLTDLSQRSRPSSPDNATQSTPGSAPPAPPAAPSSASSAQTQG
ncbi:MAG: hypothetical protein R3E42_05770 [Burkholderiaceae bacterium]